MTVTIAMVDNDEAILDAFRMMLEGHGWQVRTYVTGEHFLADFIDSHLDCVILEPHLPGISGAEVAGLVVDANIPIIGLTARPESPTARRVRETGVQLILTKPVAGDQLLTCIRTLVGIVR